MHATLAPDGSHLLDSVSTLIIKTSPHTCSLDLEAFTDTSQTLIYNILFVEDFSIKTFLCYIIIRPYIIITCKLSHYGTSNATFVPNQLTYTELPFPSPIARLSKLKRHLQKCTLIKLVIQWSH